MQIGIDGLARPARKSKLNMKVGKGRIVQAGRVAEWHDRLHPTADARPTYQVPTSEGVEQSIMSPTSFWSEVGTPLYQAMVPNYHGGAVLGRAVFNNLMYYGSLSSKINYDQA